jgi:hypothetical protein
MNGINFAVAFILLTSILNCSNEKSISKCIEKDNNVSKVNLGSHYQYYQDCKLSRLDFYDFKGEKLFILKLSKVGNMISGTGFPLYFVANADTIKQGEEYRALIFCAMHNDLSCTVTANNEVLDVKVGEFGFSCLYRSKKLKIGNNSIEIQYKIKNEQEELYSYAKLLTVHVIN